MGQIKFIGSLLLISLFTLAIMNYAINFGTDNDAVVNLDQETKVSNAKSSVEGEVKNFSVKVVSNSSKSFSENTQDPGDEIIGGGGTFKNLFLNPLAAVRSIFGLANDKIFGGNKALAIIPTALVAFLSVVALMYIYKTIFGKNPD